MTVTAHGAVRATACRPTGQHYAGQQAPCFRRELQRDLPPYLQVPDRGMILFTGGHS